MTCFFQSLTHHVVLDHCYIKVLKDPFLLSYYQGTLTGVRLGTLDTYTTENTVFTVTSTLITIFRTLPPLTGPIKST